MATLLPASPPGQSPSLPLARPFSLPFSLPLLAFSLPLLSCPKPFTLFPSHSTLPPLPQIFNFAMSNSFTAVDFDRLQFPAQYKVSERGVGCQRVCSQARVRLDAAVSD